MFSDSVSAGTDSTWTCPAVAAGATVAAVTALGASSGNIKSAVLMFVSFADFVAGSLFSGAAKTAGAVDAVVTFGKVVSASFMVDTAVTSLLPADFNFSDAIGFAGDIIGGGTFDIGETSNFAVDTAATSLLTAGFNLSDVIALTSGAFV